MTIESEIYYDVWRSEFKEDSYACPCVGITSIDVKCSLRITVFYIVFSGAGGGGGGGRVAYHVIRTGESVSFYILLPVIQYEYPIFYFIPLICQSSMNGILSFIYVGTFNYGLLVY